MGLGCSLVGPRELLPNFPSMPRARQQVLPEPSPVSLELLSGPSLLQFEPD